MSWTKERRHHTREFELRPAVGCCWRQDQGQGGTGTGVRVNQLRQWRLDFKEEERNGVPKKSWLQRSKISGRCGVRTSSCGRRTRF